MWYYLSERYPFRIIIYSKEVIHMNISEISQNRAAMMPDISQVKKSEENVPEKENSIPEHTPAKKFDEYSESEKDQPIGLYSVSEDENGEPRINYDPPEDDSPEGGEKCTANTDKVDSEIKMIKEKAEEIQKKLKYASGEEKFRLEKQLRAVNAELMQKDNDSYRRQNTIFTMGE